MHTKEAWQLEKRWGLFFFLVWGGLVAYYPYNNLLPKLYLANTGSFSNISSCFAACANETDRLAEFYDQSVFLA